MTAEYEVTYVTRPDINDEAEKAIVNKYNKVIVDNGATMAESRDRGKRRFACEINKYREGTYHIMIFATGDIKAIDEFGRSSRIDNQVLRLTIIRSDK